MRFAPASTAAAAISALLLAGCTAPQAQPAPVTPSPSSISGRTLTSPSPQPSRSQVASALQPFYQQQPDWAECGEGFECAELKVPLDYDKPRGPTIEIAIGRRVADDPDARLGSLLTNPGGPGASGVEYARQAGSVFSPEVLERYDIVGFDPRGVASSGPVDCLSDPRLYAFIASDASPDDDAEVATLVRLSKEFARGCKQLSGELLSNIGTVDAARDIDVLRAVVGDAQLHYFGKSYGTYLGATYAGLFPENVGRMVLDGAVDPTLNGTELALGQAAGFELALDAFLADCLDNDCPLGPDEAQARAALDDLLRTIDTDPLPTGEEEDLTQSLAVLGIALPLYLPADQGYPLLRQALEQAQGGDGAGLMTLANYYLDRSAGGGFSGNQNEAIYAVNCVDREDVSGPEEVRLMLDRFRQASPIFGEFIGWSGLPCAYWPVDPTGSAQPVRAPGARPILVVGTTGDPATPYAWAAALARQLESGVLLTYEGSVHTAYGKGSGCIDTAVDRYLLTGEPPEPDARCE